MEEELDESTPLKAALFESVYRLLNGKHFALKASRDEFIRRRDGIVDVFQLVCKDGKIGYRIQPNLGIRIDRVEKIFHQTSGFRPEHMDGTSTMGAPIGTLLGGSARDCEILLESKSEIASVTEKIMRLFHDVALPYFERWSSLAAIDAELNNNPSHKTLHRGLAWFRCSTGIIVAKLIGRPDYEQLARFYTEVMSQDNKGFYLKRFEALLKALESKNGSTKLT
jgi:hypothetical protein